MNHKQMLTIYKIFNVKVVEVKKKKDYNRAEKQMELP